MNNKLDFSGVKIMFFGTVALILASFVVGCSSPLKYQPRAQQATAPQHSKPSLPVTPSSDCQQTYQVVAGDTLSQIAEKCGVSLTLLNQVNDIDRPDKIYIGQRLRIPLRLHSQSDKVIARSSPKTLPAGDVFTQKQSSKPAPFSMNKPTVWQWPTDPKLDYQWQNGSDGLSTLSVFGEVGDEIYAVSSGVVAYADNGIREFGNMIMLKHASGKLSVYAHNQTLLVKVGQQVKQGDLIATMGTSGMTIRPMLHLEARHVGKKIALKSLLKR